MTTTTAGLQQVANVMVPISDQDAAIDFYVTKLGLSLRADIPFGDGDRWVEVGPEGGASIALCVERGEKWIAGRQTGITLAAADAKAEHARLREAGVDVDAEIMTMEGPPPDMFWFRDLDGNELLVVETPA
jgi:catechol 2,3-dioxygenase-like lactoylglutathione lyase family enzyme